MIQPTKLFLLASALLFANCFCKNSDIGNGPRDEERKEDPKFILTLGEGLKKEELCANKSIPLILKGENPHVN